MKLVEEGRVWGGKRGGGVGVSGITLMTPHSHKRMLKWMAAGGVGGCVSGITQAPSLELQPQS